MLFLTPSLLQCEGEVDEERSTATRDPGGARKNFLILAEEHPLELTPAGQLAGVFF
jgi:hypothetical protein